MLVIRLLYLLAAFSLAGCGPRSEPVIGEGFVAPTTLNLRAELGPRQPSVATIQHGQRVEILAKRRRFAKVRAPSGAVGWIDGELLFSPEQMEALRALGARAAKLPSQGDATVLDPLNVHTQPERQSPSFLQLREGQKVAVIEHRLVTAEPRPVDWTLVRMSQTQAGWVLTRMLYMAIPDEVAQYAEGHRITSYFSIGEVKDGDAVKHNWLWTTIAKGLEPYEFDSFRVFVWSLKRHRYETAAIERNLKGYYPVEVHTDPRIPPRFSLIVEEKTGVRQRRTYAFQGFRVRLVAKDLWYHDVQTSTGRPAADSPARLRSEVGKSFWDRTLQRLADWRRRLLGG